MTENKHKEPSTEGLDKAVESREGEEPKDLKASDEAQAPEVEEEALSEEARLKKEIEKLQDEKKGSEDKYIRLFAEFDNYKKRVARDQNEFSKFANEKLLRELLPVMDNLERALKHSDGSNEDIKSWVEGVALTFKQFAEILSKSGVTAIESVGTPFDPSRQQAMAQVETEEHEENTVVEEYQKGYMLHDRVLRVAMVTVAKKKSSNQEEDNIQE